MAAALVGFIGASLEEVREGLVEDYKKAKKADESRRLANAAEAIAELLNADLELAAERFQEMRNIRRRTGAVSRSGVEEEDGEPDYQEGDEEPGLLDDVEPRERTDTPVTPSGEEEDRFGARFQPPGCPSGVRERSENDAKLCKPVKVEIPYGERKHPESPR